MAITADPVHGGASHRLYRITRGEAAYALRMPAQHRNDPTSHTLQREIRLLAALRGAGIPHAKLVAHESSDELLGAPFLLVDWIDGFTPRAPLPPDCETPFRRRTIAESMIDALTQISNVDWRAIGLDGFGKPDGFLDRQVDRWLGQLQRAQLRPLPHVDDLCGWMLANKPKTQRAALIHGDYTFLNVICHRHGPPEVAAVVDWESATLGDPLLDLGGLLACWEEADESPSHATYFDWHAMPPRLEMAERYARATGLDVTHLRFYMVLALFKFAVIMEGWYSLYVAGRTSLATHAAMETGVPGLLERAAMFADLR
jgi:aminoglycoside phosphotransferase (APT) family kinase protein